ncbi:solute carrier family 25 member 44-like isoform X3 [Lethenteron reissneri]|uniref:solute carrier family 25 member 44-like isoform X3 n=1 Tax=Lethenteron reissneri TaxID=7753 RepID=UPI002AB74475|nr:solute carrier family 25 member 44-like isoform X3 [Lethenteron reissneri]
MNADGRSVRIIEWEDLDKRKFFTLGIVMTLAIRAAVYPASLIRTRLQVQKGKSVYKGTADAFAKIARAEGARGLYRGFLVNALTIVSGQAYVTTYELARLYVSRFSDSNALKSLVAGGCASLVAQSITVPIDIISQHLMIQGKDSGTMGRFHLCATEGSSLPLGRWRIVAAQILRADGPAGFYRGYTASLLTYIPNSAVWWPFYHAYTAPGKHKWSPIQVLTTLHPEELPRSQEIARSQGRGSARIVSSAALPVPSLCRRWQACINLLFARFKVKGFLFIRLNSRGELATL